VIGGVISQPPRPGGGAGRHSRALAGVSVVLAVLFNCVPGGRTDARPAQATLVPGEPDAAEAAPQREAPSPGTDEQKGSLQEPGQEAEVPAVPFQVSFDSLTSLTPRPLSPRDYVFSLAMQAKQHAKDVDPDAALATLLEALGRWPDYDADVYHAMAMVIERKIRKGLPNVPKSLLEEKLEYLLKAKSEIDAGNSWVYDPMHNRSSNLQMSIRQARKEVERAK
jgi:hypothetical protein